MNAPASPPQHYTARSGDAFIWVFSFFLSSLSLTLFFVSEDWRSLLLTMLDNTGEFDLNKHLMHQQHS
jgi:hypothetical protein